MLSQSAGTKVLHQGGGLDVQEDYHRRRLIEAFLNSSSSGRSSQNGLKAPQLLIMLALWRMVGCMRYDD